MAIEPDNTTLVLSGDGELMQFIQRTQAKSAVGSVTKAKSNE